MKILSGTKSQIIKQYLNYKHHVCRQVYEDIDACLERRPNTEAEWPEYTKRLDLVSKPSYLNADINGEDWLNTYLGDHVQRIQELKQHHVHTVNKNGERVPLTHCRRPDNPKKCKGDFPRTLWLVEKAVVLCQGLLKRMGMVCRGRRNKFGAMHGPQNEANINGSHPAMLAALDCNSDVQLPYRFPHHRRDTCRCIDM